MQFKFLSKLLFSVVIVLGLSLSPVTSAQQDMPGLPVILTIPTINVNAQIDYVGLTPQGALGTPVGPYTVAWFNLGPRPGNIGSSVIDGHFGTWKKGFGSVFDNLNKLQLGDKIYVQDEKGMYITFVVKDIKTYGLDASVPGVFFSADGLAHLNLITCSGTWIGARKTYSNRLVIFTDRI